MYSATRLEDDELLVCLDWGKKWGVLRCGWKFSYENIEAIEICRSF